MKTRKKNRWSWWIAGSMVMTAILAGLYMYGKQTTSESRVVLAFASAMEAENSARIGQLVYPDRGNEPIGDKDAARLLTYLIDNNLLESALRETNFSENRSSDTTGRDEGGERRLFAVRPHGKWLGIFQRYRIVVATSSIEAFTNLSGTAIKLEDEMIATADADDYRTLIGPLVPGSYRLEAAFAGAYATLRTEAYVTVKGGDEQNAVDLSLNGGMVHIKANDAPATIYIDGHPVGTVVDTDEGLDFGPLALDGSNVVHAEKTYPWGVARSPSVPVENHDFRLDIDPNTEALKEAAINAVTDFVLSYMDAYSNLDASLLVRLADDRKEQLAAGIEDYRTFGLRYEAKPKELAFDMNSIYVQTDADDSYWMAVSVRNRYLQRHYADDEPLPAFEEVTETVTYRLALQGEDWIVNHWFEDPNFSNNRIKVFNF